MSHITGGGLTGNLERIIPNNLSAYVSLGSKYPFHDDLFSLIESKSNLSKMEMLSTFNCGVGMVIAVSQSDEEDALGILNQSYFAKTIGKVEERKVNEEEISFV